MACCLAAMASDGSCVAHSFVLEARTPSTSYVLGACTFSTQYHHVCGSKTCINVRADAGLEDAKPAAYRYTQAAAYLEERLLDVFAEGIGTDYTLVPELHQAYATARAETIAANATATPARVFF